MQTLLESISSPKDLHKLNNSELKILCEELRKKIIETVAENGGHLASNLGTVELTVALHYVLDCPNDSIVWDVGHQCYSHKLLTGRYTQFNSLRKKGGITGFPNPKESKYDAFIAGHSSTSISVACGLAKANTLEQNGNTVVAVVGDGAMTGGLTFEGLSNCGVNKDKLIVVLNDNHMSINKNVGFVAKHLANLRSRSGYIRFKNRLSKGLNHLPGIGKPISRFLLRVKQHFKYAIYNNSSMFEEMGFYYFGPIDGHNVHDLISAVETAKKIEQPVLLHVETIKGKGYMPAVENPDKFHGVSMFDIKTGNTAPSSVSFSSVFGNIVTEIAEKDEKIIAITAAMKSGTGLGEFATQYPNRFFDVGIAEEHAVTFASALASKGFTPIVALYSTFLQRTFDQLLNDTSIMNNHIVLAIDRSGVVPDDGVTHQGIFDVPMLNAIPGMTIFSPANYRELKDCMKTAIYEIDGPVAVRYPKGKEELCDSLQESNCSYSFFEGKTKDLLLVTYGRISISALKIMNSMDFDVSVLKLNCIKPIANELIEIAKEFKRVIFLEESSIHGGIGESFGALLAQNQFHNVFEIHAIDGFIDTCKVEEGLTDVQLDENGIVEIIKNTESDKE